MNAWDGASAPLCGNAATTLDGIFADDSPSLSYESWWRRAAFDSRIRPDRLRSVPLVQKLVFRSIAKTTFPSMAFEQCHLLFL